MPTNCKIPDLPNSFLYDEIRPNPSPFALWYPLSYTFLLTLPLF